MIARIPNALRIALREIRRNVSRALLTMLGVIIGVSAVITMTTLGDGATQAVRDQISSLGSNLVVLSPGSGFGPWSRGSGVPNFTEEDVTALRQQIFGISAVAPVRDAKVSTVYQSEARSTSVTGSTVDYFQINRWELASGRFFTEAEVNSAAAVGVIGSTVAKELLGTEDPIGKQIRVGRAVIEIVGLLKSKGQAGRGDQDDTMIMPLTTLQRRLGGRSSTRDISMISISVEEGVDSDLLLEDIAALMRERRNLQAGQDDDFNVFDTRQIAETLSSSTQMMTTLLASVAGVSLLVGGIGIMNIMLVSVTERTREIGIRLAIGARPREVLEQFLVEAIVLSSAGGLLGILLAVALCATLAQLIQVSYVFNSQINLIAFGFSAAVGVIFGFAPARRAARLDPIQALARE